MDLPSLWGTMGHYGALWGTMGHYGALWGTMGHYGAHGCEQKVSLCLIHPGKR